MAYMSKRTWGKIENNIKRDDSNFPPLNVTGLPTKKNAFENKQIKPEN